MDKNIKRKLDGRYEITELIGEGGMADVYKAIDVVDNKVVAVKILKREFSENEEFLRRFRNESKAIAVLSHPNIVKIYDVGFSEKIQFIVMEYIDGITLKEYIENERMLSWKEAVHFVTQILRALQHAHERGIVHRDIKPQNIMVFTDGTIKVMDFGIAKFAREEGRTATDQAIGTVHYISPEQARGDITDAKSDLYSVGIMLYEMLTGKKPFDSDNPVSIAVMHMQNIAELPRRVNPNIPFPLEEIIVHAMEKNSSDRYQTAVDMMRDIDRFKADPDVNFGYLTSKNISAGSTRYFSALSDETDDINMNDENYTNGNDDVYNDNDVYEDDFDGDYDDYGYDEPEKKKSLFVPVLSAVTVVVIMVAVFFIATLIKNMFTGENMGTSEFAMPNLVGMDYNQAVEAYPKLDIQVESTEWSELEKDKIFFQSVPEGDGVKKGEIIKVKVSLGAKTVKVPDVKNYHFTTAGEALTAAGLEFEFKYQENREVDEEIVFDTEPGAMEEVAPGTTILVYVSKGRDVEEIEMESFVGKNIHDAKIQCGVWGITVKTKNKDSSEPKGTILEQSILEGEMVPSDSTITFVVSTGKEPEGTVNMTFYFPANSTGRFIISAYQNGVKIFESFTLSADYSKENQVSIAGKGTDVEVTIALENVSNGLASRIGRYNMNFEEGKFTVIEDNIDAAFETVNGLIAPPTDPPSVPQEPVQQETPEPAAVEPVNQDSDSGSEDENAE